MSLLNRVGTRFEKGLSSLKKEDHMEQKLMDEVVEARLRWNIFGVFAVRLLTITTAGLLTPILVLYVTGSKVADSRFFMLQAAFHITALTLDAPFGYLADRYGRRRFITGGAALLVSGALCYAFSYSLTGFLTAEILLAIGQASIFGAEQALLRDSLERLNRAVEFQKLWGYALSLEMGAAALTTMASGYLFQWDRRAPFFAEAVLYSVLLLVSLRLYEAPRIREGKGWAKIRAESAAVFRLCLWDNAWLRWMILTSSVWSALLISVLWCQAKLLIAHGVEEKNLGLWFAALSIFAGVVGILASRRAGLRNRYGFCLCLMFALTAGLFLSGVAPLEGGGLPFAFVGLLAMQLVRSGSRIYFAGWMKEELPSEFHATGSSINTAMNRLGFVVLAFAVAPFLDDWSPQQKFLALGWIALGMCALLLLIFPKAKKE